MKKLALFLVLCLLLQAVGLTAFAEDTADSGELILAENPAEELPDEGPVQDAVEEHMREPEYEDDAGHDTGTVDENGDSGNFVLDDNDYICEYNGSMTGLVLPIKVGGKTVKGITETAFSGNSSIQSIAIPYSPTGYTFIENGAFRNCTALESFSMANPVDTIVAEAFEGCTALKAISWPQDLATIEHDAFNGCTSLKAVGMTGNLVEIGDNAFRNCSSLLDFDMEDSNSLATIGSGAFYGCSSMKAIILPKNLTTLKNSAFENCSAATKLSLPNGLGRIESYTFRNCSSLKNLTIPASVTYIGQEAFNNCSALDWISISPGIQNILKNAFTGTSSECVIFMRGKFTGLKISTNGLGTTAIIVGSVGQIPQSYANSHGMKFISTTGGEAFIARCYTHLLGRSVTFSENLTQIRNLATGRLTAATLVKSINDSSACKAKNWNDTQFIKKLYRIMLKKEASSANLKQWRKCLKIGMTRDGIINGVAQTSTYKSRCKTWLLTPGSVINANYRDRNYKITFFVHNAYQYAFHKGVSKKVTLLNLEYGCTNIINNGWTGFQFLHTLLTDKVYTDQKQNVDQYVDTLYRIYLNRLPNAADHAYWVNQIVVKNHTRAWVEEKFANSKEFRSRMKKIGIKPY